MIPKEGIQFKKTQDKWNLDLRTHQSKQERVREVISRSEQRFSGVNSESNMTLKMLRDLDKCRSIETCEVKADKQKYVQHDF